MSVQYFIGIDLGTTNSVVAYLPADREEATEPEILPIPQLVAAGTNESLNGLASFLYIGEKHESGSGTYDLDWAKKRDFAVGELARRNAAEVPQRSVGGAKSWLAHHGVDRHDEILPYNAPDEVAKVSPVTATRLYLEHLIAAWNSAMPDAPLEDQEVVLTVPASFDASARELTHEAAIAAGLPAQLVLLEEPQAAVYAWLADQGDRWRRKLSVGSQLLVCDVGGGTTDLTLVGVSEDGGNLFLERLAVGNHLLVGGDNMDLALAYEMASQFAEAGNDLDPWQSVSLWHACRAAKERLLGEKPPKKHSISVLGRGSKLVGGTISRDLKKQQAIDLLLEGFFPGCKLTDRPAQHRTSGFQEMGLPFESDAAITRHVAAFLNDQSDSGKGAVQPTHVLFNGGVFRAALLRRRMKEVIAKWFKQEPTELSRTRDDLDVAVARGAAYYGWSKHRGAIRIRGGTARSYYVGIESAGLAVPGTQRPLHALCVVPFGMEEGTEQDVPADEIGLVVGEPAQFRFFGSSTRKQDQPGDVLRRWSESDLQETDPLEATLTVDDVPDQPLIPVRFQSRVTELGMFELWCVSAESEQRWKLEFSVREET